MISLRVGWQSLFWALVIIGQTLIYGTYSILVNLSKVDGKVPFLSSSLVFITEVLKLLICLIPLAPEFMKGTLPSVPLWDAMLYSIPGVCYAVNNNLSVFMQSQMDPATYMVLGNFKILSTGILYQLIMKKKLSHLQWCALGLLTLGGAMSSLTALNAEVQSLSQIHITSFGLCLMALYCLISGFAGVYTEYQFKSSVKLSLSHQNALLYCFGIIFNFGLWIWQSMSETNQSFHIFDGFSATVWVLVFIQCTMGLGMSIIVKYKSNMIRMFVISSAPLVTTFLSYIIFHLHLQPMFLLAAMFVAIATFLYNLGKTTEVKTMSKTFHSNV